MMVRSFLNLLKSAFFLLLFLLGLIILGLGYLFFIGIYYGLIAVVVLGVVYLFLKLIIW